MDARYVIRLREGAMRAQVKGLLASLEMLALLERAEELSAEADECFKDVAKFEEMIGLEMEAKHLKTWTPPFKPEIVHQTYERVAFSRVSVTNTIKSAMKELENGCTLPSV